MHVLDSAYLIYIHTGRYPMSDALYTGLLAWVHTGHASPEVSDMLAAMDVNPDMRHVIQRQALLASIVAANAYN